MNRLLCAFLFVLLIPSMSSARVCTISWDAPTTNVDGTPITDSISYRLYSSLTSNGHNLGNMPFITTSDVTVDAPCNIDEFWVVTAVDTGGNESLPSNEVFANVSIPNAPGSLTISVIVNINIVNGSN